MAAAKAVKPVKVAKTTTKAAIKAAAKEAAKVAATVADIRVWCEGCCIRIAPSEEFGVIKGKSYHARCYSKVVPTPSKSKLAKSVGL